MAAANRMAREGVGTVSVFTAEGALSKDRLGGLLAAAGFRVDISEAVNDTSRASNLPVEYVRATRM